MKLKILFILLILPAISNGQSLMNVHETATLDSRIQTINVCSTAIDVAAATSSGTLSGAFAIEVYNHAASTNTINCGFDPMTSSTSSSAWYGREVPAGVGMYFGVQSYRKVYCVSQNSSGCTRVTISQFK